jgi:hypothetical protein
MRKASQEIFDQSLIEEILSKAEICRIAMIDKNQPYMVPFNYGYRDNCIYIHSAPSGKKIDLLRLNNHVCFEIEYKVRIYKNEKACKWGTMYRSVIGYGQVEIMTDHDQKRKGLEIIMAQHGAPDQTDFDKNQMENMVILKLKITGLTAKQSGNWTD